MSKATGADTVITTSVINTNHVWLITCVIIVRNTLDVIYTVLAVWSKNVRIITITQERADDVFTKLFTVMTAIDTLINVLTFKVIDFYVPLSTRTIEGTFSICTFLITVITLTFTFVNVLTVVIVPIFQLVTYRTLTLETVTRQWFTGVRAWSADTRILN